MKTPTAKMWEALESQLTQEEDIHSIFPKQFLVGLRLALEAGISCQQITSMLILQSALFDLTDKFEGESLVQRTRQIVEVMQRDL